jgi:hypothetical protein
MGGAPRPARGLTPPSVRFLLDEMYPPMAAQQLRERGVDAVAVKEFPDLRSLDDGSLLAIATLDQRVLVTENVSDFATLARTGQHVGLVFCHPARFPRTPDHLRALVDALVDLDADAPAGLGEQPMQWWLSAPPPQQLS